MSAAIVNEAALLGCCILLGVLFVAGYEALKCLRRLFPRYMAAVADFLFWCAAALFLFSFLCRQNDGIVRGFALGGVIFGALLVKLAKNILKLLKKRVKMFLSKHFMGKSYGKPAYEEETKK